MRADFLKRLTHLKLGEMGIAKIEALEVCERLRNLYLFDNTIRRIENLSFARNLTHLYLQNNQITKIEGLDQLTNLTKLYLGGNAIHVLEGLDTLARECLWNASCARDRDSTLSLPSWADRASLADVHARPRRAGPVEATGCSR